MKKSVWQQVMLERIKSCLPNKELHHQSKVQKKYLGNGMKWTALTITFSRIQENLEKMLMYHELISFYSLRRKVVQIAYLSLRLQAKVIEWDGIKASKTVLSRVMTLKF